MRPRRAAILGGGLRPSLDLNFLFGSLDPRITFTRASTATRINAAGAIESVASGSARFDHDPVTLAIRGLLIEDQRTNLLLNSTIDGANLATQSVAVTAQAYTLSFYGTGTVTLSGASTAGPLVGSGAYPTRSTLTFTPSAGSLTLTVSGTVQFAQLEAGAFATSYIPTGGASATRAGETARILGADFAALYNPIQSTLWAEALLLRDPVVARIASLHNATNTNRIDVSLYSTVANQQRGMSQIVADGATQLYSDALTPTATGTVQRIAIGATAASMATVKSGGALVTASGVMPVGIDRLSLGEMGGGGYFTGHIRRIRYWPRLLPNTMLQSLTA